MGKKQIELAFEHMNTNIRITNNKVCHICPYRLYANDKDLVTLGTGNIHSNFIFILPTYDTKAKLGYSNLLSLLHKSYYDIVGRSIFEDSYITRLVKCNKTKEYDLYTSAIGPCSNYLIYEINRLNAKNIVFFGSSYEDYISNSSTVGMNIPFKNIHKLYSPAVLLYDNSKIKEKFMTDLTTIVSNYQ